MDPRFVHIAIMQERNEALYTNLGILSTAHRSEAELAINIRKATNAEETAPKRKHVRSCIVYTWDHKSSQSFWSGMKVYVAQV